MKKNQSLLDEVIERAVQELQAVEKELDKLYSKPSPQDKVKAKVRRIAK
jgi:hypothetical protein